jgi:hypothetical protein
MKKLLLFLSITVFFFSCRREPINDPYTLPDSYSNQSLGQSANDLLSASTYTAVTVQVQYMPGYQLDPAAIANVTNYLNARCNKPGGVTFIQSQIPASGDTLDPSKVAALEKINRTAYTAGNTLALYIMVTDGYDTAVNTLGFAYRNTSLCLLGKNIFDNSGGFGQITRVALETSVLEHELGHILGLVNKGSPMQSAHQDVAHGNHCTNPNCLMYYAIELNKGLGSFSKIPALDSNCIADLRANGGK